MFLVEFGMFEVLKKTELEILSRLQYDLKIISCTISEGSKMTVYLNLDKPSLFDVNQLFVPTSRHLFSFTTGLVPFSDYFFGITVSRWSVSLVSVSDLPCTS